MDNSITNKQPALSIMDGGMGGELIRRGVIDRDQLWSAAALLHQPDLVRQVHADYIAAGAALITTNTYSTVPSYLAKGGLEDQYVALTTLGAKIAREVADQHSGSVQVAGSLPPLDESYRFDLVPAAADAIPIYAELVQALLPFVDVFLCETMSCSREGKTAASVAAEHGQGKPVYLFWTLHETPGAGLRSGESIEHAVAAVAHLPIAVFGFNCSTPESILAALPELRSLTDKPIGAYPNKLSIPADWTLDNDVPTGYKDISVDEFLDFAQACRAAGANHLGGCCGIGPEYIRALSD